MHFQQALVTAMKTQQVTVQELAERTNSDPRWILTITTNCEWKPKLDTILRLCYALRFNTLSFIALAERGSFRNTPDTQYINHMSNCTITEHFEQILDLKPRHISLALKAYRLEHGLSQRNLEKLTPFSVSIISMREGNHYHNYPTVTTLCSYCNAYNISLMEFLVRAFSFISK